MSREIKFRVWDKKTNCYDNFNSIKIDGNGVVFDKDYDWQEEIWYDKPDKEHGFAIEQYTGLKDKNGKEIYEGDIVEQFVCGIHQFKGKKCGRRTIWEVRWNKKECCFELHYLSGSLFGDSMMSDGDEYEVIGNVHKNKGLLGGEE